MERQSFLPDEYDSSFLHLAPRFDTKVGLASLRALAIERVSLLLQILRAKAPTSGRQANTKFTTFATF